MQNIYAKNTWIFLERDNYLHLVHNCSTNTIGDNCFAYAWRTNKNENIHCYCCKKEPPEDILTQAKLLDLAHLKYIINVG